jgi:hypothetical protein
MSLHPNLVNTLISAYSDGMSDAEVAELLNLSMKQFEKRVENDELFKEAVEMGRTKAQAWWMRKGRENLTEGKLNTNLWMYVTKNRFGWADKTELVSQGAAPDSLAKIKEQIAKKMDKLQKGRATDAEIVELASYKQGTDDA